ncbi:MAG TPA: hypothetical protein VHZ02_18010, partial [Acidimicrobiales bacterium]|nr:hypothetical protein [Acidimicrobiales bacterium]
MRLFVAIWPPPPVVAALSELEHPHVDSVRWTDPARWHITLVFLGDPALLGPGEDDLSAGGLFGGDLSSGDAATADAATADAATADAAARLKRVPFDAPARTVARVGAVTASFGRSVLYVPVLGLDALAGAVRAAFTAGVAGSDGTHPDPFNGHLTLGRARRRRDDVRPLAGMSVGQAGGMEWTV